MPDAVSFDAEPHIIEEQQTEVDFAVFDCKKYLLGNNELSELSGPPVHEILVEKFSTLFSNGSTKEARELLVEKYPAPFNLPLCKAPILNQEICQAIPSNAAKRDA